MAGLGAGRSDPVQGPNDPAERARAAARESAAWLRDEAGRLYDNYSKQSKFFKWRSWIIAAYVALSIVSLGVWKALTGNDIKAYVTWTSLDDMVLLRVTNNSAESWTHVRILLNGQWEFEKDRVLANEDVTTPVKQFHKVGSKAGHESAPGNIQIKTVKVRCDQGSFTQASE
jgi:hypothetical protein